MKSLLNTCFLSLKIKSIIISKFKFLRLLNLSPLVFLCISGTAISAPQDDGIIRMGGSTTLLPVISKIASDYMETYETWDKVSPSFPNKTIVIFVSGGGSGFGVKSTINGTVHIGMASRNIKNKEKKLLGKHKAYLVGKDAVVFATNKNNPLANTPLLNAKNNPLLIT